MPQCFILDIPVHQFLHHFLLEGKSANWTVCLSLSIADLPRFRFKHHRGLPPGSGYIAPC